MKSRLLFPAIAGIVVVLASLACGSDRPTTTNVYQATNAPTESSAVLPPPNTAVPQPTNTAVAQIALQPGQYTSYTDSIGTLWVVGEILNQGTAPAQSVEVAVSLLDGNGSVLAVGQDTLSYVAARGKFPFRAMVDNAPNSWAQIKIQIQGSALTSESFMPPYVDFKTSNITGAASDFGYALNGTVTNTGQKTATLVHVTAIVYDQAGKVLDVNSTFTTLTDIAPGGDSPFSIDFRNTGGTPGTYEVFAVSFSK